jgi:hypothetical protein
MNNIPKKRARTLALCGDHSNYTFEQAGYNTAGRDHDLLYNNRPVHFIKTWPTSSSFRCAPYGRPIMPIFIVEIDSTNLKKSFGN